jgi:hypothetical protein
MSNTKENETTDEIYAHLKNLYHQYRHDTEHIPSKAQFFSPTCMQLCRPMPNFSAVNRETIVQYLIEAAGFKDVTEYEASLKAPSGEAEAGKSYYTIRPLTKDETNELIPEQVVAPLGITPTQLDELRWKEGWTGMRVDLWDDPPEKGRLIKVKYWWRKEVAEWEGRSEEKWVQCLHDIMSIGARDGKEGEGLEVIEQ